MVTFSNHCNNILKSPRDQKIYLIKVFHHLLPLHLAGFFWYDIKKQQRGIKKTCFGFVVVVFFLKMAITFLQGTLEGTPCLNPNGSVIEATARLLCGLTQAIQASP